jgi:hypothetical protein
VKRIIIIAGFLILGSLALAGVAQATPPSNLTSTTLGRISLGPFHESSHGFKISSRHPTDVVVLTTTINPGGSTGWQRSQAGTIPRLRGPTSGDRPSLPAVMQEVSGLAAGGAAPTGLARRDGVRVAGRAR